MKDVDDPKTADSVEIFRGDAYGVAFIVPRHCSIVSTRIIGLPSLLTYARPSDVASYSLSHHTSPRMLGRFERRIKIEKYEERTEGEVVPRTVEIPIIEERVSRIILDNIVSPRAVKNCKK